MSLKSMTIAIPEADLVDLRNRLNNTRWPTPVASSNWEDGTDADYLRDLMSYWSKDYNWREREEKLNTFRHYVAEIDGTEIHFIRADGVGPKRIPLLVMQGWPSSFVQILKLIPLLTENRSDGTPGFDIIAASLPGYPFTTFPDKPGMNFARIADLMKKLMVDELGYEKFVVRGSDQGALVMQQLGLSYPEHLIGLHRAGIFPFLNPMPTDLTPDEKNYQEKVAAWAPSETAYYLVQRSRPETLAPALSDSPVALASWYIEKFQRWGDTRRGIDATFGRDELLDNLSLHWFTNAGAASIRLYRESARDPGKAGQIPVPTAIMMPLHDKVTVPAPRAWAKRMCNLVRWTEMDHGGHFPEWEVPDLVADDIRQFVNELISGAS